MRNFFLTILFFSLLLNSFSQYAWPPEGVEGKDYYKNSVKKPDGLHYRTYGAGNIYYVGVFENGKPKANTEFIYYFDKPSEGIVMTIHNIQETSNKVLAVNYYANGKVMSEGMYIDQKKEGAWIFNNSEGFLKDESIYKNNLITGTNKLYDEKGNLVKEFIYSEGKKNGPWIEYFKDGTIRAKGVYKDDNMDGKIIYYTPRGSYEITGGYINGQMDGIWKKYNKDNNIEITTVYKNGKKTNERRENGTFKDYWNNDIPKAEYVYEDGKKNGPFTEWHDMGDWTKVPMDVEGSEQGYDFKLVLKNTQISREGDYLDDLLEGEVFYYNENGRLMKTETYVGGVMESVIER